jgi:sortase A
MRDSDASVKRSSPRWLERALLLIGVLCLGVWAYARLDAGYFQYRAGRLLEKALSARHSGTRAAPAADTDTLESFRRSGASQARTPAPEGTLVGRLEIPRLGLSAIVLEGVGDKTLRRAVGHIPETLLPEEGGNVGLAGHRDSFFRELKDVRQDDLISLQTLAGTFRYRVAWTKIVQPEDTEVLAETGTPALTLVTCYPFHYVGAAPERFIVRARPLSPSGE